MENWDKDGKAIKRCGCCKANPGELHTNLCNTTPPSIPRATELYLDRLPSGEQKHLCPVRITPEMSDEQADVLGVLGFTYVMNQRLTECRHKGKGNWHIPGSIDPSNSMENEEHQFRLQMKIAMNEGRWVDAANYAMMLYHREQMKGCNCDNSCNCVD